MKKPISTDSYVKLLTTIETADNHVSKVIKKYRRIIKEATRNNDIESAYLAYEIITMILGGTATKYFSAINNRLLRSIARCKKQGPYSLEVFLGKKFELTKDGLHWILHNRQTNEKFFSKFYEEEL